jgi:hypothetical protein
MENIIAKIRSSVAANPNGCGYVAICTAGAISVISVILGELGNYQAVLGMPFWGIAGISIAGMVLGPILALRGQHQHYEGMKRELEALKAEHPQLSIEFVDNCESFIEYDRFVVRVWNRSSVKTARRVVVQVFLIEPMGIASVDAKSDCVAISGMRLFSSLSSQGIGIFSAMPTIDINSGAFAKFAVVSTHFWENQLVIGNSDHASRCLVKQGAYRITLRASGDDCVMDEMTFAVGVNSGGKVIFERDKSAKHPAGRG